MEFLSCKYIEHEAVLDQLNKIRHCSNTNTEFGGRPVIIDDFYGDTSMLKDLFKNKQQLRRMFRNGQIPKTCQKCIHLETKEWDDNDYINYIVLTPWTKCNCKCIYCPIQTGVHVKANTKEYDYYKTIKYMIDNNFFSEDAVFDFAGGEPALCPKFNDILKLIDKRGYKTVINTNSTIYSKEISKLIEKGKCILVTSLDSGNRELFQKIKQLDAFDKVCSNLKKYALAQKEKKNAVRTKYIIIPNVNDSEKDILEWLKVSAELGVISVILNLDFNFLINNHELIHKQKTMPLDETNLTLKLYNLIDFTYNEAAKLGITVSLYGEIFTLKTIVENKNTLNVVEE